jgi:hypothetical protein
MSTKRGFSKSNNFSENHRTSLPSNFCLFDIDGILIDEEGEMEFLYEGKYKITSKDKGDFIKNFYNPKNHQAFYLRLISEKIGVYIHEEITDKWWFLYDRTLEESKNPRKNKIKTENRIYIEDIVSGYNQRLTGIFLRTEGEKPCSLLEYTEKISGVLQIPVILVNDTHKKNRIFFKKLDKIVDTESSSSWEKIWGDLGIYKK